MTASGPTPGAVAAGVGPDGAMFVGVDSAGASYTVYRVTHLDDDDERRRRERRFLILQSFAIDRALALRKVDLAGGIVVVQRVGRTLTEALASQKLDRDRALAIVSDVAESLAGLHRAGLSHGALDAHVIHVDAEGTKGAAFVDVSGLRCTSRADALSAACRSDLYTNPDDIYALGVVLLACLFGADFAVGYVRSRAQAKTVADNPGQDEALSLASDMLDAEPSWRPTASDVVARIAHIRGVPSSAAATISRAPTFSDAQHVPKKIGRFDIEEMIGEGAMGRVYRARDPNTGAVVAVKVLSTDPAPTARALRRFKKEARILSEIRHPNVAALLDAGEDEGRLWMAVEYVEGETLAVHHAKHKPMPEQDALRFVADVCRALVDVHERGVVHRDLKPENVLVQQDRSVKLIDFGIARHFDETESLAMTRVGAIMGTPLYMAPEQAKGDVVDARSDVYALGTILFELIAGEPPFAGHGAALVLAMQQEKTPPKVTELRSDASDEVARLIQRALEKDRGARFADARAFLAACTKLLGEEPATIAAHPRSPVADGVQRWVFEWDLASSPRELWPYVSNTDRLNRAIGLGAVDEKVELADGDPLRFGHNTQVGFDLRWREHPYEWVFERRIGVLRDYSEGPLRSMRSTVDLQPREQGTHLVHTVEIDPRGVLGRVAGGFEVGIRTRRALERVYRRIDDLIHGSRASADVELVDAFEAPPRLSQAREERLRLLERKVVDGGASARVVARLGDYLRTAAAQDVSRIRPLALARRLGVDDDQMVRACLLGVREGMLVALWDLLCPSCRVPAGIEETLRAVKEHGRCEVCNIDFALDLATSIEMVFKVHPQIRAADTATYCLSSPGKTPHVMAQVRLAAGERFLLETALPEGSYQLVGRRLPYHVSFRVRGDGETAHWELSLKDGPSAKLGRLLRAGRQEIVLVNDTGREHLIRVEKTLARDDVFTAARAAGHPLFRQLFPNEVLEPGALVRVSSLVLVYADIRGGLVDDASGGDARAFSQLYAAFKEIEAHVASAGGSVVKLMGDGVLAVFDEPGAAVRAALKLDEALSKSKLTVRAAVHRGPAAAVTLNERLDYFGKCVDVVTALAKNRAVGRVVVSDDVLGDPVVQEILDERAKIRAMRLGDSTTGPIAIA